LTKGRGALGPDVVRARADHRRVSELCDRYADADIGFVDAAVLAITERLDEPKLATLDRRHFSGLRPRHVEALRLLPD
jgi:predicted nucleic acid-binding protein